MPFISLRWSTFCEHKEKYVNENFCILIEISLKFVPKVPTDNNPALFLDNGLAPNRRQAIIPTNVDQIHWPMFVATRGKWIKAKETHSIALGMELRLFCIKPSRWTKTAETD